MPSGCIVRKNAYYDSVFLMRVAKRIAESEGMVRAAAVMGTENNKESLGSLGIGRDEMSNASANDLIVAIEARSEDALNRAFDNLEEWLHPAAVRDQTGAVVRTLSEAVTVQSSTNLAVISVPGEYAAREARNALEMGLNVFLFSDNVSIESEVELKRFARERGLIVMGPDCGTAIIAGIGIGFANIVRRGPVGVIGASGTGIQEITTLVHRAGSGVSHAIGIGSHDLSDAVDAISALSAFDALEADVGTKVIVIISKPPGRKALKHVNERIRRCRKPVVTCFLGTQEDLVEPVPHCQVALSMEEAARLAVAAATGKTPPELGPDASDVAARLRSERAGKKSKQKYIRGVFAGGTFCYQAQQILRDAGIEVHSNAPLEGNPTVKDSSKSVAHTIIDMGADEFTKGRPHPMIDSGSRRERIEAEGQDLEVAVLLLDFILGFNCVADPAGELIPTIRDTKRKVEQEGGDLTVVASVCGTEEDPQGLKSQVERLEEAAVVVFPSTARAARFCTQLVGSYDG